MYQSTDRSSKLMSMNARTRVPTYSQQGMLHLSSTINTCSPWLNRQNTTLDTRKGGVLLNLLITNAPTFVCPGLSSYILMSDQGTLSCQSYPQGHMALNSIFSWDYHNRVSSVVFPPNTVSSALPSTCRDDKPALDGLATNPQNSGPVENFSRRRDAKWW